MTEKNSVTNCAQSLDDDDDPDHGKARDQVGKAFGVSGGSVGVDGIGRD